jgi:hypothetical protein
METTTQIEPTSATDLKRFCGFLSEHMATADPWVSGGWRYATDGRVCVRVPAPGEPDTPTPDFSAPRLPPAAELFPLRPARYSLAPWPTDGIEPGHTPCWECNETGIVDTTSCDRCRGMGCKKCKGHGWTGGRSCTNCDGFGQVTGKGRRVGEHLIALRLDRLVRSLPGVFFLMDVGWAKPLPFVFDGGGEGIVMGMPRDRPAAPREAVTP